MTGLRPSTTGIYGLSPWFRKVDALKDLVTLNSSCKLLLDSALSDMSDVNITTNYLKVV